MDEDLILREIVKNLTFEIEAVNQENVLKWSTTNGTPLNVKVRVRNKDEPRLVQRGTMPVPRIGISAPEKLALVSSNQTILSFSVYLQEELERKVEQKRQSGFKLFNIGSCLGTYSDDDEGPYLPSSSNPNAVESNTSINSSSVILKKKVSEVLSTSNTVPRTKKSFFGKCKPGGCLDPPFGEDNYSYGLERTDRQENLPLGLHKIEYNKESYKPGGCLDPPFSEEEYPYILSKTEHQEKLGLILDETADNRIERRKKSSERSKEHENFIQKTSKEEKLGLISDDTADNSIEKRKKSSERSKEHEKFIKKTSKDEGDPKNLTDIYARTSVEDSLKLKYSNSIITYPTDKHSKERVSDQIPNKKISIKSYDDDLLRQSYEYPESYFVPPKDIMRYKEEERRHVKKVSTDQLSRSSKVSAHDTTDKLNLLKASSQESEVPQKIKGSKDTLTEKINLRELQTNDIDITLEAPINKRENVKLSQFPIGTENLQDDVDVIDFLVKQEQPSTQPASRDALNKLLPKNINKSKTENLDDGIHITQMQVNEDNLSARDTGKKTISQLFSKESNNKETENLQTDSDDVERLIKQGILSTQHTSRESLIKLSPEKIDKYITENIEDNIHIPQMQQKEASARDMQILYSKNKTANLPNDTDIVDRLIKHDIPSTQRTSKESLKKLSPEKINDDKTENIEDNIHIGQMQPKEASVRDMQILDSNNAQTQDQVVMKTHYMQALEHFANMDEQTPGNVTETFKSNSDKINDRFLHSKQNVANVTIPILATAAAVDMTEKQSLQYKDTLNPITDSSMKQKDRSYPEGHAQETDKQNLQKEPRNVSPDNISSTGNSDFDISSAQSMDFIQDFSSTGKFIGLLETLSQKDKRMLPENNEINEKIEVRDIQVGSETTEKKPSAILQKKPFVTKHDSDIYNDDVNKATPLKRNTFTIIGSDTSLQKSEEIEEMPENTTNAIVKTKSVSLEKTRDSIGILDTANKNIEDKIHTNSATDIAHNIKQDNLNMYSKINQTTKPISDDQACTKEEISDRSTNKSGNVLITDLDKKHKPENAYNVGRTNYQTDTFDTTATDIKDKQLPINANDDTLHSKVAEDSESTLDIQNTLKTELLDTKDRVEHTKNDMSIGHPITSDIQSQVTNNLEKTTTQNLPDNVKHFNSKFKDENNFDAYESYKVENKETMAPQNHEFYDTENKDPKIAIDRKLIPDSPTSDKIVLLEQNNVIGLDLLQKPILENKQDAYPTVHDSKAALSTLESDNLEIEGIEDNKNKTYHNGKPISETLQKPEKLQKTEQDLYSGIDADETNLTSIGPTSDEIYRLDSNSQENLNKMHDTLDIGSDEKRISEMSPDLQLVITDKSQDKTEIKDEIYKKTNSDKYGKSATDSILKIEPKNLQNLQVAGDIKDISFDQLYDTSAFVHTENNEPNREFMTENVEDLHSVMQIYNELDNLKYSNSDKDDPLRLKVENYPHLHAQTADDNVHVSSDQIYDTTRFLDTQSIDPKQEIIPEYVKDLHLVLADTSHDETAINQQMYNDMDRLNYIESNKADLLEIKSENVQNLLALTVSDIEFVSSSQVYPEKTVLMSEGNNRPTQKVLPEQVGDLHSIIDDKTLDKTELNGQIYNQPDKIAELTADHSLNHSQTADADKYITSDKNYDPDTYEPQVQIYNSDTVDHDIFSGKCPEQAEINQNLTDNNFGFKEKSRSASKNDSPFSGYSGLISEVLSNISENTEGEEKHTAPMEVGEGISRTVEDFTTSDTKVYRDHEIDNEFENIVEEAGSIKLSRRGDDIESSYKIDDNSYKVPQNSLAKSFTSTLEGRDENRQNETISKAFESVQFIAHSSDKLRKRFDEQSTDALNTVRDDVLLDTIIDITNQNSEYQSSKILGSINDSIVLNESTFSLKHTEQHPAKQRERKTIERQYQSHSSIYESKLDRTETTSLKIDPVYLDMSFYSYMNDNNQRVLQTHSPVIEQRSHDATVTVVKTLIRHGNEIRIPVDRENDISLNILDKDVRITNQGRTSELSMRHTRREKCKYRDVVDRAKRHEVINKNLALIYEHELIPLHNVIKDLTQEVNTLSAQQEKLQMKIRNAKRTKSLRLIPVVKRCGCRRI